MTYQSSPQIPSESLAQHLHLPPVFHCVHEHWICLLLDRVGTHMHVETDLELPAHANRVIEAVVAASSLKHQDL